VVKVCEGVINGVRTRALWKHSREPCMSVHIYTERIVLMTWRSRLGTYFEVMFLHIFLPSDMGTRNGRTPRSSPSTMSRAITTAIVGRPLRGVFGGIHL
jgi:hypothetical protein